MNYENIKTKYLEMKNILTIIFVVLGLILIGWSVYHYLGKHITELENCNKKYKEDIIVLSGNWNKFIHRNWL